jgi:hypothetical protein
MAGEMLNEDWKPKPKVTFTIAFPLGGSFKTANL